MRHSADPHLPLAATLPIVILRACDFFDRFVFLHTQPDVFNPSNKTVILRGCDFLSWKGLPPHNRLVPGNCSFPATTLSYLSSRPQGRDLRCAIRPTHILPFAATLPIVIVRACDFFDLSCFATQPDVFNLFTKLSSCLPRRAVGAKRLADLSHKEASIARSRRTPAMRLSDAFGSFPATNYDQNQKNHNLRAKAERLRCAQICNRSQMEAPPGRTLLAIQL